MAKQLEMEKQQIIDRKRREQAELKRKQEELDRILKDNKRKVGSHISGRAPYLALLSKAPLKKGENRKTETIQ